MMWAKQIKHSTNVRQCLPLRKHRCLTTSSEMAAKWSSVALPAIPRKHRHWSQSSTVILNMDTAIVNPEVRWLIWATEKKNFHTACGINQHPDWYHQCLTFLGVAERFQMSAKVSTSKKLQRHCSLRAQVVRPWVRRFFFTHVGSLWVFSVKAETALTPLHRMYPIPLLENPQSPAQFTDLVFGFTHGTQQILHNKSRNGIKNILGAWSRWHFWALYQALAGEMLGTPLFDHFSPQQIEQHRLIVEQHMCTVYLRNQKKIIIIKVNKTWRKPQASSWSVLSHLSKPNPPTRFGVHSLLFLCSIQNFVTTCQSKIPSPKSKIQDPQNPKSKIPKIQNPKSPKSKIQNPQNPKSKLCT